jgi:TM2 domain-containing membrane protein YozV
MVPLDQDRGEWFKTLRRTAGESEKSWTVTLCLSLCLGIVGADRFYLDSLSLGLLKLISCGGFGLWWLIDLVLLFSGNMKDGHGGVVRRPF